VYLIYNLNVFLKYDSIKTIDYAQLSNLIIFLAIIFSSNFIKEHYYLEVSSSGLEKTLRLEKHFKDNIGNKIQINLYKQINNSKNIVGILKDYDDEKIVIGADEILEINKKDISLIKTVFDWDSI